MYSLLAIFLVFALLFVLNWTASLAAVAAWRAIAPFAENWTAQRRAQTIFALRVFPFAAASIFVFAFLLPAYLLFEPNASEEIIGFKLVVPALISAVGMAFAFYRVFGTWWKTRRLVANWLENAEQITIANVKIPVYCFSHPFPVIAVVGTFRPKMFVARQIFDSLNEAEFRAAIAHECGHLAAFDNFKRTIMRVCRDLLVIPFGQKLDKVWAETAESAADEYAAQTGGNSMALNLAAALVKIARIAPSNVKPAMPAGAFLLTEQIGDVTWRVRYLLRLSEMKLLPAKNFRLGVFFWLFFISILTVALLATNHDFLLEVHDFIESIVAVLQ